MQWEDLPFILGKGKYLDDVKLPGELSLHVLRSPYARAKVTSLGAPSKSLLFLTWEGVKFYMPALTLPGAKVKRMPVLADGRVNFYGQPVAAIVAEDRYDGEDVLEDVGADYDPLEPSLELEDPKVQIHEDVPGNVCNETALKGGDLSAFRDAQVQVNRRIEMARVVANPTEPKGVVANYHDEVLDIYVSTQSPFRVRNDLTEVLGIPPEKVRVFSSDTGGAFGNKTPAYPEYVLASIASIKLHRPVKWVETRREHLTNPTQGKGMIIDATLYAKKDGTLVGVKGKVIHDVGAYNFTINAMMASFPARLITGPYVMKAAEVKAVSVFTNAPPTGPYRGAGRPEAALAHEALMNDLADELGADPVELRRKNLIRGEYTTPLGNRVDPAGYEEVLRRAESVYRDWKSKGRTVSLVVFSAFVSASPGESAKARLTPKGVEIVVGSRPHGQAHLTTFTNLAARTLGVDPKFVKVRFADTTELKEAIGTFGSRSASVGGAALVTALTRLREKVGDGDLMEAAKTLGEVEVEVFYKADPIFSPGAYVVAVKVDRETCYPMVEDVFGVDDVGKVLNRQDAEAQVIGGVMQGIAEALWEEAKYSPEGTPEFGTMVEAGFPKASQAPRVKVELVEFPSQLPHGARGVGESGTIGAMAGTFLSLEKALGGKLRKIPVLPEKLCSS
ncbi:aldehyde oxidase [Sulfodiicoccus acidiphilus]|uniref:Aldehyde oxidase n=1 Tax=Sulfodiicoccus acidiphilus TaxID=1670455 RepID=A0A348B6J8_9CREN|nr:xanthine dehydrogenase family protein molybdopterin-binding subunit [Sulfodiicoccus acidiphilus]BBD73800.1 aldehyde oxidase [Sulfodiicoccus acidiphilus]GGU03637.1 aldehyde oxidase [Sulfodiicoccus acidiphilus]